MTILRWSDICRESTFDGIRLPVRSIYTTGGRALALHTYPDVPGQEVEDQGRQATTFAVSAVWGPDLADYWGDNIYPEGFRLMRRRLEKGGSGTFVHPIWGETEVAVESWGFNDDAARPDVVEINITFVEDSLKQFSIKDSTALSRTRDAKKKAEQIDLHIQEQYGEGWGNPFRDLLDMFNSVLYAWNSTLYALESKFLYLKSKIREYEDLFDLRSSDNWPVMELVILFEYDMIEAINGIERDLPTFGSLTVGKDTDLFTVSTDIYGDETWVDDLMSLNVHIYNPARVPSGTTVTYQVKP
jgi:prophage DNA circulation protein